MSHFDKKNLTRQKILLSSYRANNEQPPVQRNFSTSVQLDCLVLSKWLLKIYERKLQTWNHLKPGKSFT